MNKEQLIDRVSKNTFYPKVSVEFILSSMETEIKNEIKNKQRVSIRDFGTFAVKHRAPRVGRNPHTGEVINIPERDMPIFEPAESLIKLVSEKTE